MKSFFTETKTFILIAITILLVVGFVIYSNIFGNTSHFDDLLWMQLPAFREPFNFKELFSISPFRFVTFFTLALNNLMFGENLAGFYFTNILIHIINGLLVFSLIRLILSTPLLKHEKINNYKNLLAFAGALIFLSHPIQTQAVTYIYQRLASISTLFYLLTVTLYLKGRLAKTPSMQSDSGTNKGTIYFILAAITLLLGLFSKEITFTLPLMLLIVEWVLFGSKIFKSRYVLFALAFIIVAVVLFAVFVNTSRIFKPQISPDGEAITSLNYLFTQFRVIAKYFQLLIFPVNQNFDYYFPVSNSFFELGVILSFLLHIAILVIAFLSLKKYRIISFGIFWIYLSLAVESSVIPIADVIYEHRLYLPMFGFVLIISGLLYYIFTEKRIRVAFFAALAIGIIFSVMTFQRNKVWENELTLWNDVIEKSPNKARAYNNRGLAYYRNKDFNLALADFNKAIELNPNYHPTYKNLGVLYFKLKDHNKAIDTYTKFIALFPYDSEVYMNRGHSFIELRNYPQAIADYSRYIESMPNFYYGYFLRGKAYYRNGNNKKGIDDLTKSIQLNGNYYQSYYFRGLAYMSERNFDNAITDLENAIKIKPDYVEAMINLARANEFKDKYDVAAGIYTKALSFSPNTLVLHYFRAKNYVKLNKIPEAIADYNAVLRIDSTFTEAREELNKISSLNK